MTSSETIAACLPDPMREAVMLMDPFHWKAGPSFPDRCIPQLNRAIELGLAEREFLDDTPVSVQATDDAVHVKVSACWHYRLTSRGEAVRKILTLQKRGMLK